MALLKIETSLVDTLTVRALTGLPEHKIMCFIEDGHLAAFHLETSPASRTLMRVASRSLLDFLEGRPVKALDLEPWFATAFPGNPTLAQVAHSLACSPDHPARLVHAGLLKLAPGAKCRRGQDGSPAVTRSSLLQFLRSREVGAI